MRSSWRRNIPRGLQRFRLGQQKTARLRCEDAKGPWSGVLSSRGPNVGGRDYKSRRYIWRSHVQLGGVIGSWCAKSAQI